MCRMRLADLLSAATAAIAACAPCAVSPPVTGGTEALRGLVRDYVEEFQDRTGGGMCLAGVSILSDDQEDITVRRPGMEDVGGFYRSETKRVFLSDQIGVDALGLKTMVWHELCHGWHHQVEPVSRDPRWAGTELSPVFGEMSDGARGEEAFAQVCESGVDGLSALSAWSVACGESRLEEQVQFVQDRVYVDAPAPLPWQATGSGGVIHAPPGRTFRRTDFVIQGNSLYVELEDGPEILRVELPVEDNQLRRGDSGSPVGL